MTKVLNVSHKFQCRVIKCPICGSKADHSLAPFCSKRCKDVDLGHWMTGNYYLTSGLASKKHPETIFNSASAPPLQTDVSVMGKKAPKSHGNADAPTSVTTPPAQGSHTPWLSKSCVANDDILAPRS